MNSTQNWPRPGTPEPAVPLSIASPDTVNTLIAHLVAHPGTTVREISTALGLGYSTAGKILAACADIGRARRQETPPGRATRWISTTSHNPALARGDLHHLAQEHLNKYPHLEFTPYQLAKALSSRLGRAVSAGAVGNALGALTSRKRIRQTQQAPRTYRALDPPIHDGLHEHPPLATVSLAKIPAT